MTAKDPEAPPYVFTSMRVDSASGATIQAFDFAVPGTGRTSITVFLSAAGARCTFDDPSPDADLDVDVDTTMVGRASVLPAAQARATQIGGMADSRAGHTQRRSCTTAPRRAARSR